MPGRSLASEHQDFRNPTLSADSYRRKLQPPLTKVERDAVRRCVRMLRANEILEEVGQAPIQPTDAIDAVVDNQFRRTQLGRLAYKLYEEQSDAEVYDCPCGYETHNQHQMVGHKSHCDTYKEHKRGGNGDGE